MPALVDRQVKVTVNAVAPEGETSAQAFEWTEHRISFTIDQTKRGTPNDAQIQIFNVSPSRAKFIRNYGDRVLLEAGHRARTGGLFLGDIRRVEVTHKLPDRIIKIAGGDGERAFISNRVNITLGPGATIQDALNELGDAMALELGPVPSNVDTSKVFLSGITMSGPAWRYIERLVDQAGGEASIQDGVIQILRDGSPTPEIAVEVTSDTNLVGSPKLMLKSKKGRERVVGINFRIILEPGLRPGRSVRLRSREFDGVYVCERVRHIGDSGFEDEYYSEVSARELGT